ncbi:MAG: hypothetical protein LC623_09340 [Halobacteriales archaeon]|nr:hypothetical protein [Halobacteriales archaeon]
MRALPALALLLLVVPLSGCQDTTGPAFVPTCPNWTEAQHPLSALVDTTLYQAKAPGQATRTNTETFPISNSKGPAQPPADENGKRADRYLLRFPASTGGPIVVENGTLTFRAYRNDTGEQLAFAIPTSGQTRMEATFSASGKAAAASVAYLVSLVPATQEPKPAALRLEATFTALPGFTIGTGSGGTPRAGASFSVEPLVSYRAPGCVQK